MTRHGIYVYFNKRNCYKKGFTMYGIIPGIKEQDTLLVEIISPPDSFTPNNTLEKRNLWVGSCIKGEIRDGNFVTNLGEALLGLYNNHKGTEKENESIKYIKYWWDIFEIKHESSDFISMMKNDSYLDERLGHFYEVKCLLTFSKKDVIILNNDKNWYIQVAKMILGFFIFVKKVNLNIINII